MSGNNAVQLRVKGKVQGVGFRPYVWQLAHRLALKGEVCNDAEGVLIRLLNDEQLPLFERLLYDECPPLARIDTILCSPFAWPSPPDDFVICQSRDGKMDTQIIPDAATCDVCRSELFSEQNRRYRYPFINCTHCGPRFTIIRKMPYDRPNTSMAQFPLCPECQREYESPADRRFHAQPNACPVCGPYVWNCFQDGKPCAEGQAALEAAARLLLNGGILALKGIGGFHLACDATNDTAVALLRQRKLRPNKPFAVMLPDLSYLPGCTDESAVSLCQLLSSAAAPIVLVHKTASTLVSDYIAPGLNELGIMLPSNPLQHLLMSIVRRPLVMTSGNASGKPPALANRQALDDLANIADMWLLHNRDIVQRADDSLLRYSHGRIETMRRARGYVPDSIMLPEGFESLPSVLAVGADLKNAFCLLRDKSAVLSPHLGDLDDIDIQRQFESALSLFKDIYKFSPKAVAVDAHPGYVSRRIGQRLATEYGAPLIDVLHHHAHIVACLAEHSWPRQAGPVIGIAVDGLGFGGDDRLWGGECLLVDYGSCRHLGGLPAVALPGGDLASRQPWRNLFAHLLQNVPEWQKYTDLAALRNKNLSVLKTAIERGINAPVASSTGRLFDAIAAALGICSDAISWEGEAACQLEALACRSRQTMSFITMPVITMPLRGDYLDLSVFWHQWLDYCGSIEDKAYAFHDALAQGFAALARVKARKYGITTIVASGGVMHNQLFRRLLSQYLSDYRVLMPEMLPMGDGGLALGQALIAAKRFQHFKN